MSLKKICLNFFFFVLGKYWRKFLRSRAQIAEIVGEILSHVEKNELTSATFLIIPVTS